MIAAHARASLVSASVACEATPPVQVSALVRLARPTSAPSRPDDVLCYSEDDAKARKLAQSVADLEGRAIYLLEIYRPSPRGFPGERRFLSPAYYVSRHPEPQVDVPWLSQADLVGPPFSGPLLVDVVLPRAGGPSR